MYHTVKSANYPPLMMPQGWGHPKWFVISPEAYHVSMYVYRYLTTDASLRKDNRRAITDHMKLYPGENSIGAGGSGSSSDPPPPPDPGDESDDGAGVFPTSSDPPAPNDPPTQELADDLNAIADGEVINDSFQAHIFTTNQAARESVAKKRGGTFDIQQTSAKPTEMVAQVTDPTVNPEMEEVDKLDPLDDLDYVDEEQDYIDDEDRDLVQTQ
uniref:Uncharacterized protein n=1 Tax=Haptolina ericina TaxID=156174 RepID=A0A7S3C3N8_9EUKA|mmetsp:Transcript_8307/g.18553  ORF Transcript_8307/g.18553 Transcript_8307/m.18553 type:complete len:213 (+) Transcript_8307:566-1204(+)